MRLGIVGPQGSSKRVKQIIQKKFNYIDVQNFVYDTYHEAPTLLNKHQKNIDAILFTGTTPFKYTSRSVVPIKPWDYLPRHGSSILTVFLKASLLYEYDITNISLDCYNKDLITESYTEIGVNSNELNLHISEERIFEDDYLDYLYWFHRNNFIQKGVSCCITGLVDVHKRLNKNKIPCFRIFPTSNIVSEVVKKLQLKHLVNINQKTQLVVLAVGLSSHDDQSILNKDEYLTSIEKIRAMEQIYLYAQRLHAAVVELSPKTFLLFSTRNRLEIETGNLQNIELVDMIKKNTLLRADIGIGYGDTAKEAKQGAIIGMEKSYRTPTSKVYVVYNGDTIIGPILSETDHEQNRLRVDEKYLLISEETGLSINTIVKLHKLTVQYNKHKFTTRELAKLYGVSERSINRIINDLEKANYVKVVGKKVLGNAGRPSRIYQIMF